MELIFVSSLGNGALRSLLSEVGAGAALKLGLTLPQNLGVWQTRLSSMNPLPLL